MRILSINIIAAFLLLASGACDMIEGPYLENPEIVDPGGDEIARNVMIFEFTGHTCKSCPKAHRTIDQVEQLYEGRIVTVAFHTGYFARTLSDKYTTDFRTEQGNEMESYFEFASFPIGLVNNLDKGRLSPYSSWPAEAAAVIQDNAPAELFLNTEYLESSGRVNVTINIMNKGRLEGDVRMAVYLVEDGIVSWQKDEDQDPIDVEDYVHNHVFRTSAGSVWGESILESDCMANANTQKIRSLAMDPAWVPENCSVVVFLYDYSGREVIQCEKARVIK